MKPFENLSLDAEYLRHNITYYAHGHATQPDGVNAAVKKLETELQALDVADPNDVMLASIYDPDGKQLAKYAENLNNGTNVNLSADTLKAHLDDAAIHAPVPSPFYGLGGDGMQGVMALGQTAHSTISAGRIFMVRCIWRGGAGEQQLFRVEDSSTHAVKLEMGIDDWTTYLKIGDTRIDSLCGELVQNMPLTLGVYLSSTHTCFFENGYIDAAAAHGATLPSSGPTLDVVIGENFNGEILRISNHPWIDSYHGAAEPQLDHYPVDDEFPPQCRWYLDFTHGAPVQDPYQEAQGQAGYVDYTVTNGVWVPRRTL